MNPFVRLYNYFYSGYESYPVLEKIQAKYLTLVGMIIFSMIFILFLLTPLTNIPLYVSLEGVLLGAVQLACVRKKRLTVAYFVFLTIFLTEVPYMLDISSPEMIIIPEFCTLMILLSLISVSFWQRCIQVLIALTVIIGRLAQYSIKGVPEGGALGVLVIAYIGVIGYLISIIVVGKNLRKQLRTQNMLIEEQAEKIAILQKVTTLKKNLQEERSKITTIESRLYLDEMTTLYNRNAFNDFLTKEIAHCRRRDISSVLIYLDLDHLKYVNDTLGHTSGDVYISTLGTVINENLRSNDLAFRLGGDEFFILLSDCTLEVSKQVVLRIRETYKELINDTFKFYGDFSYGAIDISLHPEKSVEELVEMADLLMRKDKQKRKIKRGSL